MSLAIRTFLKKQVFIIRLVALFSRWQYSSIAPLRWVGRLLCAPIYYLLQDRYYQLLMFAQKSKLAKGAKNRKGPEQRSQYLPNVPFVRAITGDKLFSESDCTNFFRDNYLSPSERFTWAQHFMGLGRLDFAMIGFKSLINDPIDCVPLDVQLRSLRHLGIVSFLVGNNNDANHYWQLTGQVRRILLKPTTPKDYRILGPGWHAAFGHIGMLDYYVKYLQLYGQKDVRVVAPWQDSNIPWKELMAKFEPFGIVCIDPDNLETDYNEWAIKKGHSKWHRLSESEKLTLVDEFWEYDFPSGVTLSVTHGISRVQTEWEHAGRAPLFSLTEAEKEWVTNYLSNFGIPKDAWYVCLHVRESGFHKEWNSLYPSMRDADINDYHLAIEKIVNAGGWVLRMGDASMKPLPPMRNVIDYAHSPFKTPTADILLAASCRFILGTNSGYVNVCAMYNVPCALTNWVPIGWPLWLRHDLMIPKLFRDKEAGQYLSLEEIFKRGLAFYQNWSDLPASIELVSNTPEELAQVTLEMLAQCNLNIDYPHGVSGASDDIEDYYRSIALRYGSYTGSRLARTFVEKYGELFAVPAVLAKEKTEINKMKLVAMD